MMVVQSYQKLPYLKPKANKKTHNPNPPTLTKLTKRTFPPIPPNNKPLRIPIKAPAHGSVRHQSPSRLHVAMAQQQHHDATVLKLRGGRFHESSVFVAFFMCCVVFSREKWCDNMSLEYIHLKGSCLVLPVGPGF